MNTIRFASNANNAFLFFTQPMHTMHGGSDGGDSANKAVILWNNKYSPKTAVSAE